MAVAGPSEDDAWFDCVRSGTKSALFAMQTQGAFVTSHLVTTQPICVRGVWLNDEVRLPQRFGPGAGADC
jgi:hypothetical protein